MRTRRPTQPHREAAREAAGKNAAEGAGSAGLFQAKGAGWPHRKRDEIQALIEETEKELENLAYVLGPTKRCLEKLTEASRINGA